VNNAQEIVERYLDIWNETDAVRRGALIRSLFTESATYTDPLVTARGLAEIDALVAGVQAQFPGFVFTIGSAVDAHHDTARFKWNLGAPGAAEPLVVGFDIVVIEGEQVRNVYGFLDKVPAAA
jgi:hypothetical protein